MRRLPSLDLWSDVFDDMLQTPFISSVNNHMKTNVYEKDGHYEFEIELPGVSKEDIKIKIEKGYLVINANTSKMDEHKDGNMIRQERYSGSYTRSFYVSDSIKDEDVKAKFENGILFISVLKEDRKKLETSSYIAIE